MNQPPDDDVTDVIELILRWMANDRLCQFCGHKTQNKATRMTSTDDSVCEGCYQEFEDALEKGDSE